MPHWYLLDQYQCRAAAALLEANGRAEIDPDQIAGDWWPSLNFFRDGSGSDTRDKFVQSAVPRRSQCDQRFGRAGPLRDLHSVGHLMALPLPSGLMLSLSKPQ
jgi:hypothetical protein